MSDKSIPLKPEDVTPEWLENVLRRANPCSSVEVLQLVPISTAGFLSKACTAEVKIGSESHKLFLKINLPQENPFQTFISGYNVDAMEVKAYKEMLPKLTEFESQFQSFKLRQMMPTFFAGDFNPDPHSRGFYLVLSDISQDYKLVDHSKGLTIDQLADCLAAIAHFHALALAFGIKHRISYSEEYPLLYKNFLQDSAMIASCESNFQLFKEDLKALGIDDKLIQCMDNLSKSYKEKFPDCLIIEDDQFLSHGDFWSNNVMFGKGKSLKVIDWQFLSGGPPLIDFAAMAYCNCDPDLLEANLDTLHLAYYESFEKSCRLFKIEPPFSFQEMVQDFQKRGFSMTLACYMFFYDPIGREKFMVKRLAWILKMAAKHNPDLFE